MRRRRTPCLLLAFLVLGGAQGARAASVFEPFIGAYVGRAEEMDANDVKKSERDIDLVIEAQNNGGLRISWSNVTLVDGRRDVPGVRRHADEVLLTPAEGRPFYLARAAYDPFSEAKAANPLAGDPLRWGMVKDGKLAVYSLVIEANGRYELQSYLRERNQQGMGLSWQRIVDGEVQRKMTGETVRAE